MRWFLFIVCTMSLAKITFGQDDNPPEPPDPTVTIEQGTVIGSRATDGEYFEFFGIPYADSPAGVHRFKAPRPPPLFQDTFIANRSDIRCVRALDFGFEGVEDCLVANIFTPSLDNTKQLPVMVWIKGTEFDRVYEQELSFKNFMEKNVIVVSLNYRESILGFLCLGTETAPGNAGLKDIVAGLKWVKDNIEEFGGNPDDITIFGHGSGGAAIDLITLSPMADGLVSKAIAQSGNAMAPWAVSRDNLKYALQVAEELGHEITDLQQLSDVFMRTSLHVLMLTINNLDLTRNVLAFAPCIEREGLEGVEPFLIKTPSEALASGEFLHIPFITGFVNNEGTIRADKALKDDWLERMDEEFEIFLQADLQFESEDEMSEVATQIREFYFEHDQIDFSTIDKYIAYHGETMVLISSIREARARADASLAATYLYQFSYKGVTGEPFVGPLELETAEHSEELAYLFHESPEEAPTTDFTIRQMLVERWTNFAKTGYPTSESSSVNWEPYTTESSNYLRFMTTDEIIDEILEESLEDPYSDPLRFWDEIYSDYFQDAFSYWSLNDGDDETTSTPIPEVTTVVPTDSTEEPPTDPPDELDPPIEFVPGLTVQIAQGTVMGYPALDGEYFEFLGIPYADSTSGTHRFKAPREPPLFQDIFIANRSDVKCVRALGVGHEGTEDCLVANIFTPSLDNREPLPVMVWIKGTEFDRIYEHELSFKNFMKENVIVVSLNYRESILGFLCLGTETAPGNAGLKDIVAGLKWVKENINQFGGNPDDITLFGHGSGGAAVDLITLSPMADGLVNKAIAQSGNAVSPWAVTRDNLKYAVQVAEGLGHVVTDIQHLSDIFTRTNVAALMGIINQLDLTNNALAFGPCIERKELEGVEPFLIKTPSEILTSGEFPYIPFITGFVDNEGTIRAEEALEDDWLDRMDSEFKYFLQADLKFENEDERSEVANRIRKFYFEDDRIDFSTMDNYIAYHGETMVLVSSIKEVRARARISSAPIYLYQFSYKGITGEPFVGPLEVNTAAHSEELAYLFKESPEDVPTTDLTIRQILVERWTHFAKTGIPSSDTSPVQWRPFTSDDAFFLRIIAADEIIDTDGILEVSLMNPYPGTLTFWDEIYSNNFQDAGSNWSLGDENGETSTSTPDEDEDTSVATTDPTDDPPEVSTTNPPEESTLYPPIEMVPGLSVTIAQGTVMGYPASDGEYYEFFGIPYADSTSGTHRFKAPREPPLFQDIFIANRSDVKCVRALGIGHEGTEDCLVANIFTPSLDNTRKLPVMVWIKGTEFDRIYEHEIAFKNFMEENVIVVSLNYRESILGFLCLGTETAPGNAGLKDIVAGLKWVKQNIEQFGGNPDDITIFGHGSGGAAIDLITLSPMANGLVNKAIAQSGNAVAPWAVSRDNLKYAIQVAEGLGHIITDIQQLSDIFVRTSLPALMGIINELDLTENALAFAPCIEREELEGVEPFLIKTPSEILASGEFSHIPFITGFVDNEGTIRAEEALEDGWLDRMNSEFVNFLQADLKFESEDERSELANQIRQFYFEDNEIDFSTIGDYITYHGETMVLVSSIKEVRARATVSSAPIYLYQFSYKGVTGEPFVGPLKVETAAHSEELAYLFNESPDGAASTDHTIRQILVERWTNFAKTGFPTSVTSPVIWQPFTTDDSAYLRILDADEIIDRDGALEISLLNPHPSTMTFWEEIYSKHFRDAESNWSLNEREEEDESSTTTSAPEEDGITTQAPDSASTFVGYTFLIMILFSILGRFHLSQLVS